MCLSWRWILSPLFFSFSLFFLFSFPFLSLFFQTHTDQRTVAYVFQRNQNLKSWKVDVSYVVWNALAVRQIKWLLCHMKNVAVAVIVLVVVIMLVDVVDHWRVIQNLSRHLNRNQKIVKHLSLQHNRSCRETKVMDTYSFLLKLLFFWQKIICSKKYIYIYYIKLKN